MSGTLLETIVGGVIVVLITTFLFFLVKSSTRSKISDELKNFTEYFFKKKMRFNSADYRIPANKYRDVENLILQMNQNLRSHEFRKFEASKFKGLPWALKRSGFKIKEFPEGIRIIGSRKFRRIDGIFTYRVEAGEVPVDLLIWINNITDQKNNRIEFYRILRGEGVDILGVRGGKAYSLKSANSYLSEDHCKDNDFVQKTLEDYVESC